MNKLLTSSGSRSTLPTPATFDESFRISVQKQLSAVSEGLNTLRNCREDKARSRECKELQKTVQSLQKSAADSGMRAVAREAAALESLVKELSGKPSQLNDSSWRTLTLAVDVLGELVRAPDPRQEPLDAAVAVIVDAERLSSSAAGSALRNAGFDPHSFTDPALALKYLNSNPADLVVLDATTATQSGMDLYARVRELPLHQRTPIITVSNTAGEAKRPPGMMGETQFLPKPYNMISYLELTLKAISRVVSFRAAKSPTTTVPLNLNPRPTEPTAPPEEQTQSKADLCAISPTTPVSEQSPHAVNSAQENSVSLQAPPNEPGTDDPGQESEVVAALKTRNKELEQELAGVWQMCGEVQREFAAERAAQKARSEQEQKAGSEQEQKARIEQEVTARVEQEVTARVEQEVKARVEQEVKARVEQEVKARVEQEVKARIEQEKVEKPKPDPAKPEPELSQADESTVVDRRVRQSAASCARATAELERERGERRRLEQRTTSMSSQLQELHGQIKDQFESETQKQTKITELEEQLRQRDDSLARANTDLQKETEERQLAEEQLRASKDLSGHLRNCITSFETAKQAFKRRQDELDLCLQGSVKTASENEARLQKETSERQRAQEALRNLQERSQKDTLELSKLQSALEVEQAERKRLEGDAIQARYASLDSARANLLSGNKARRQMREPVETLMHLTRRLLENPLEEEPKKLVESLLENALLLQCSLQDLGNLAAAPEALPASQSSGTGTSDQDLAAA